MRGMEVAVRVDASMTIGLGHLKRCLSLAAALAARGAGVRFVARDLGVDVAANTRAAGFACEVLPAPRGAVRPSAVPHAHWAGVDAALDAEQTLQALGPCRPDWVLVDHYSLDAEWHRALASGCGARLAVVDDVADRALAADVLIDHNHSADHRLKYGALLPAEAAILGGPRYALLGPSYATAPRYAFSPQVRSIGIFMGGADAGGHSSGAWRACREHAGFGGRIEIAATHSNPHGAALRALCKADAATTLTLDSPSLEAFFARHDIQIGAGGGATWERCCIGVPTVASAIAENQLSVLVPLRDLGVLRVSSAAPSDLGRELRALIDQPALRESLAQRARQLVDGLGAGRVADYLIQSC
jgi:UDP-2,4-diacetamido-2,4,6-trideoxy-beta-L-altropyranose hydrolase